MHTHVILIIVLSSSGFLSYVFVPLLIRSLKQPEYYDSVGKFLIVLSLDGFRPDYITEDRTPNLWRLKKSGSFGKMKPMFTSLTFPNHLSIATGLYEENHGVVSNDMYDPKYHEYFNKANNSPFWWDNGYSRPIWVANQILSEKGHSGTIMWPGSMSTYQGYHSDYQIPFIQAQRPEEKVELFRNNTQKMMKWMKSEEPANLVLIYFDEPDSTSHVYPPFSEEVWKAVALADKVVGILVDSLVENHFFSDTNLMIVSDHGFAIVNESLDLTKTTDMSLYLVEKASTAVLNVWPKEGKFDQVYEMFKNLTLDYAFKVYRREEISARFKYRHNRRIGDLVVVADHHLELCVECWKKPGKTWGNHGYDNGLMDLRALFLGHGPDFRESFEQKKTFYDIDLYPLMTKLMNLPSDPKYRYNGTFDVTKEFLR